MKKFNILALAALAMAFVGDVNATTLQGGPMYGTPTTPITSVLTSKGQLALARLNRKVGGNNLLSGIVSKGTPANALAVSAASNMTANTKGGTKARYESTGFISGAQVTNEQTSQAQGGTNLMGLNTGASNSLETSMLTGANLNRILANASGTVTSGTGTSATSGPGTFIQPPTSAISTMTSNTKNAGSVSFGNKSQAAASLPANPDIGLSTTTNGSAVTTAPVNLAGIAGVNPTAVAAVPGAFGNVSSKMVTSTVGSNNTMGGSTGSAARYIFGGNYSPNS